MNERIQELANECTDWVYGLDTSIEVFDKERFAELIVWECYAVAKSNLIRPGVEHDLTYNDGVTNCAIMIKQHFGVE